MAAKATLAGIALLCYGAVAMAIAQSSLQSTRGVSTAPFVATVAGVGEAFLQHLRAGQATHASGTAARLGDRDCVLGDLAALVKPFVSPPWPVHVHGRSY